MGIWELAMARRRRFERSTILLAAFGACALGVGVLLTLEPLESKGSDGVSVADASDASPTSIERRSTQTLAPSVEPATTQRSAEHPQVRGTLTDTSTGLPLAGYTIELRPRRSAAARRALASFEAAVRAQSATPYRPPSWLSSSTTEQDPPRQRIELGAFRELAGDEKGLAVLRLAAASSAAKSNADGGAMPYFEFRGLAPTRASDVEEAARNLALVTSRSAAATSESQARSTSFALSVAQPVQGSSIAWLLAAREVPFSRPGEPPGGEAREAPRRTVTDAQGRFAFDCPEDSDVVLAIVPHERDWFDGATLRPSSATLCSEPIDWRVERSEGALVRGRVVDVRTMEPIEGLTLALRGERDEVEEILTDADGRFATSTSFPSGALDLTARDGDDPTRIELEPREARVPRASEPNDELLLLARLGPTLHLRFQTRESLEVGGERVSNEQELPAGAVELRIRGAQPVAFAAGDVNPFAEWRAARDADDEALPGLGWVRWPTPIEWPRGGGVLELRSTDRAWASSVPIRPVGALTDVEGTTVVLERAARIAGTLTKTGDEAFDAGALRVSACRDASVGSTYESALCDSSGSFALDALDARCVRFLIVTRGDDVLRIEPIALEPGEETTLALEL